MSFDVEQHLHYRIANAQVLAYPFPHFYIPDVFPADWYWEARARLPEQRYYKRLDETGAVAKGAYVERFVCDLGDARRAEIERDGEPGPWSEIGPVFEGPEFAQRVLSCFNDSVVERFGQDSELDFELECRLVRDFSNYAISPHTDTPRKLVSLLFYMPSDDSMRELGTSIFAPNDPNFRCDGRAHHPFKNFKKVMTAPYLPNSLLGFFKTDRAFHGVERIERPRTQRDSLLYNIYVKHVGKRSEQLPA
jgi:hypothetical protein